MWRVAGIGTGGCLTPGSWLGPNMKLALRREQGILRFPVVLTVREISN